jgi:ketosteroid isomerase-like protein
MNRRTSITLIAQALLLAVVVLLAGNGKSYAQQSGIKTAIDAFHAALTSLDVKKMDAVWAHESYVMLINPSDKSIAVGWDAVRKKWEETFNSYANLKVTETDGPHIHVKGNVAWATGIATAELKTKAGAGFSGPVFETDVFEKHGSRWLLVSHTALRAPQ